MEDQEFQQARNDFDLENIHSRLINCICELQSKRNEAWSLKSALDDSNRSKSTLEQDVKNYQREVADLRDQLKIALDALNQKDAVRTGLLENAARQNVQLEAMTNDHERLNAKIESSQLKIMELTRENNRLQEQIKTLQSAQSQPVESVDRIWKAMNTLNGHLQKLEAEHAVLTQTAESSNKMAEEAAVALVTSRNNSNKVQTENVALKRQILLLESKLISLTTTGNETSEKEDDTCKKLENHLKTVTEELDQEREANGRLRTDISSLLALQECLTKQLEEAVKHYESNDKPKDPEDASKPIEIS